MDVILGFWRDLTRGQRIMMGALAVYFVSLFLPYLDHDLYAFGAGYRRGVTWTVVTGKGTTSGWEVIEHAWLGLCILVGVFATDLCQHRMWRSWVFWAAVPALLYMSSPSAPLRASGGALALLAVAIVVWAAVANWRATRAAQ